MTPDVLESRLMAYDDLKEFDGQAYSGMSVGGEHRWLYPNGRWRERKVAPDRWEFTFASAKERERSAPEGSGVPLGTQFHWYILAHQRVRKVDRDTYTTFMEGLKYKLAHKRPHWRRWSDEYPDQLPERERLIRILEKELAVLRDERDPSSQDVEEGDLLEGQVRGLLLRDRPALQFVDAQHLE
jgi:hypothetical protein